MPTKTEVKIVDPVAELSSVMRKCQNLAPQCSIAKRAGGTPQLAPQENQMDILKHEMTEARLCINLAKKGRHAIRDAHIKKDISKSVIEYEYLEYLLRDERSQQTELDILNYLSRKLVSELIKLVPTESDALSHLENAQNRLRRMENRLDLATKRLCVVNSDNKAIRDEIHRLLVERDSFNVQWNKTIENLVKGKEYLMEILEIATNFFGIRDEATRLLETLKWKGLFQLNRDIAAMQSYDCELNHLTKLEEFLRVKGSKRICEADEIEEEQRQEEIARCNKEIKRHDKIIEDIYDYVGTDHLHVVIQYFRKIEIENDAMFILLCELLQESTFLKKDIEMWRQRILDQRDTNQGRVEMQDKRLAVLRAELDAKRKRTKEKLHLNVAAEASLHMMMRAFDDLTRLANCKITPLLYLLGNHKEVTQWNVRRFIKILELEVKSLIQVVYGIVKPPAPTPEKRKGKVMAAEPPVKAVADPYVEILRPNKIEDLVPYQPCAYCVEDYIMNMVFETPAVPADEAYIQKMLHLEDVNTKFGIFTLTIPARRHPLMNPNKNN